MAAPQKKTSRSVPVKKAGQTVFYRGVIKLAPPVGKRSSTAVAIRNALKERKSGKACDEPARS
jgi:hypothetical protein